MKQEKIEKIHEVEFTTPELELIISALAHHTVDGIMKHDMLNIASMNIGATLAEAIGIDREYNQSMETAIEWRISNIEEDSLEEVDSMGLWLPKPMNDYA